VNVQQGQLSPTDTTKDMENFYSDAVISEVVDVTRAIHNGTQFVRLALQRAQPISAIAFTASGSVNVDAEELIDGSFVEFSTTGVSQVTISFNRLVKTSSIVVYSTSAIDTVAGNWTVQTSLNNLEAEFIDSNFDANITSVVSAIVPTLDGGNQFRYTLSVDAPPVDTTNAGLPFWRLKHSTNAVFDGLTEVQIIEPLNPTISYFDTDGDFASSFEFEQPNIIDAAYDNINEIFYTIRFNDQNVGTATITLDDNFSDGDAGTASGTTNFNPGRWTENSTNSAFLRTGGVLSYNVSAGKGQLETTYTLEDFTAAIDVNPTVVSTANMWFAMRALDGDNKALIQEGVGLQTSPTTSGVIFGSAVENFTNATAASTLRDLRPLWHNTSSGTDSFTITFNGSTWAVTGTQTGALTDAQTGVAYTESTDSTTPISFLISSTASPTNGENFTFDVVTENVKKEPTATGILVIERTGSNFTTGDVFITPKNISSTPVTIELFGNTNGSVNISADNFDVTGSGIFPDVNVFSVERTDNEGDLVAGNPTVIESFDIIGDPSKSYNSFLDGRVQIACTQSGSGGGFLYIKVEDTIYKYANNVSLTSEDGSNAVISTQGQIPTDGTHSLAWTHESGIGGLPFLTYHEYEESIDIIHLRTLDKDTLVNTTDSKEILLEQTGYSTTNNFKVFYDQNDFDTLYYVDGSTNLQSFNIDDRISAFMAVNAEDVTLPAGTSQQTFVNADVINAWGEVLSGKVVTFAVTAGDGAISPSSDTTDSEGRATSQFTVGSTVGVSTVTATVTET
jgi:hypothetical protein